MVQWLERPSENLENVHIMLYGPFGNYTSGQRERGKRSEERIRITWCMYNNWYRSTTTVVSVKEKREQAERKDRDTHLSVTSLSLSLSFSPSLSLSLPHSYFSDSGSTVD